MSKRLIPNICLSSSMWW